MNFSNELDRLGQRLATTAAEEPASSETLRALAVQSGSLVSETAAGGAALFAHSLLLLIVARMESELVDERASTEILRIVASLAELLRASDKGSALAKVAANWIAFQNPESLH